MTHPITYRSGTADDLDGLDDCFSAAFYTDRGPGDSDMWRGVYEPDRWDVAVDAGRVVGTAGILTRDLGVPGAVVPAAHVSGVAVRPGYRRRGILTHFMRSQLTTAPEAIAVLWASQSAIYRRYGYRDAASGVSYEIDAPAVGVQAGPGTGRIREVDLADIPKLAADVYTEACHRQPGMSTRPRGWWKRAIADPENRRGGASALRAVVHENADGTVDGYALWRVRTNWTPAGAKHVLIVTELVAPETDAYAAIWSFLTSLDMIGTVEYYFAAVDERLPHIVAAPRVLNARLSDSLWVRIIDVARALAARKYAADLDVVLEVTDPFLEHNAGRYRLTATGNGPAACARTGDAPDLTLGVDTLAGVYLGGRSLVLYARTGEVTEHTPGTFAQAAVAFGWPIAPVSLEVF